MQFALTRLSHNKKLIVNMAASLFTMLVNYAITFFFTPYLIDVAGEEAYGFVQLANNLVSYAGIVTLAIDSVAGRFVSISYLRGDIGKANGYFNSTIIANIIFSIIITLLFFPIILTPEQYLNVPTYLINDVRWLLVFVCLNYIISLICSILTVAAFITNNLFLTQIGNSFASLVRVGLLFLFFGIFPPHIAYVSLASCIATICVSLYNGFICSNLQEGLSIRKQAISFKLIAEMLKAGIWSSITKLSQVLSDGLDLLISDIAIGAAALGQLSVAYAIPSLFGTVLDTISSVFNPRQTMEYAANNPSGVVEETKLNMKMTGFFISVILAGVVVFGLDFFRLWVPSTDHKMIYELCLLSCVSVLASGVASPITSIFLICNKLKTNSLVWLFANVLVCVVTITVVLNTNFGIYAIAGISKVVALILLLTFTPIYACRCLGVKRTTFYPVIARYLVCTFFLILVFEGISYFLPPSEEWGSFLISIFSCGFLGLFINFFIFLSSSDRRYLLSTMKRAFKYGK